jgi:hypothetical protein
MKITIHDHNTSHAGKRAGFLFNIVFSVGNEHEFGFTRNLAADFADIAAYLVATGEVDGYADDDDDGQIWVHIDEPYDEFGVGNVRRSYAYDFNEFIREHVLSKEGQTWLADYCKIKVSFAMESVIEDIVLL